MKNQALSVHIHAGAPILSCVAKGVPGIFMDCHMMVAQPEKVLTPPVYHFCLIKIIQWVDDIADAGGALYCFHLEATGQLHSSCSALERSNSFVSIESPLQLIKKIHSRNMKAGVAISPDTQSTAITDQVGEAADMLLVMTVYPGKMSSSLHRTPDKASTSIGRGGQKFIDRCVPKVSELRARFPEKDIEVDGGVGPKTIDACANAGI